MKKKFQKPDVKLVRMEEAGIICSSGSEPGPGPSPSKSFKGTAMESYGSGSISGWFNS